MIVQLRSNWSKSSYCLLSHNDLKGFIHDLTNSSYRCAVTISRPVYPGLAPGSSANWRRTEHGSWTSPAGSGGDEETFGSAENDTMSNGHEIRHSTEAWQHFMVLTWEEKVCKNRLFKVPLRFERSQNVWPCFPRYVEPRPNMHNESRIQRLKLDKVTLTVHRKDLKSRGFRKSFSRF